MIMIIIMIQRLTNAPQVVYRAAQEHLPGAFPPTLRVTLLVPEFVGEGFK